MTLAWTRFLGEEGVRYLNFPHPLVYRVPPHRCSPLSCTLPHARLSRLPRFIPRHSSLRLSTDGVLLLGRPGCHILSFFASIAV